jgi:hypothetical protein
MTSEIPTLTANGPNTPPDQDDKRERVRHELEHRFRHNLRTNHICPLLHLVMRYKLESPS